ncbi:MAG: sigma-54 interaction domain-containing protein [Candidatus Cryptobacteroides sp.]
MDAQDLQRLKNKYDIIGNDPGLNRAIETAVLVAPTDLTVLVTGESGVGKENIPKIIHQNSLRRTGKYFAINCGAIPEGTVESELFGHEKGSFTGAVEARKGYFEEADGGTLFLDEIGELPLPFQAKLLRVLQSGEYNRVGSSKVSKTDVRVIAATNVDLAHAVARGKFREDLYYRLNAVQISMPSLRERKSDIYLLFRKFSSDFADKFGMRKVSLTHDAIELLTKYRWPGNIRQLKNIAETVEAIESQVHEPGKDRMEIDAATLSRYIPKDSPNSLPVRFHSPEGTITEEDKAAIYKAIYSLSNEIKELKRIVASGGIASTVNAGTPSLPDIAQVEDNIVTRPQQWKDDIDIQEDIPSFEDDRQDNLAVGEAAPGAEGSLLIKGITGELIRKALEKHGGNRKKAAAELGISERTLYRKLPKEYKERKD